MRLYSRDRADYVWIRVKSEDESLRKFIIIGRRRSGMYHVSTLDYFFQESKKSSLFQSSVKSYKDQLVAGIDLDDSAVHFPKESL